MRPSRAIPLALLLAIVVRLPFWIEALHTPVDGDTAIVGLMARHPGVGTTFWGQPYGSPLDSWVALPFVAAYGVKVRDLKATAALLARNGVEADTSVPDVISVEGGFALGGTVVFHA